MLGGTKMFEYGHMRFVSVSLARIGRCIESQIEADNKKSAGTKNFMRL